MPEFKVTWKKEYVVNEPDELTAVDEAEEKLKKDMAQQFFGVGEFFDVAVQKEPVKEIHITAEVIKEFQRDTFEDTELAGITDEQINKFVDYLNINLSNWLRVSWSNFMGNKGED